MYLTLDCFIYLFYIEVEKSSYLCQGQSSDRKFLSKVKCFITVAALGFFSRGVSKKIHLK